MGLLDNSPPKALANAIAIDPRTGKPYSFSSNDTSGWTLSGTPIGSESGANAQDYGLQDYQTPLTGGGPDWYKSIGFTPPSTDPYMGVAAPTGSGEDFQGINSTGVLEAYLQSKGLTVGKLNGDHGYKNTFQAFDKNGNPVGSQFTNQTDDGLGDALFGTILVGGLGAGALAAAGAAGAGAGGAGALATDATGATVSSGAAGAGYGGAGYAGGGVVGGSAAGANGAILNPGDYSWAGQGATTIPESTGALGNVSWGAPTAGFDGTGAALGAAGGGGGGGLLSSLTGPGVLGQGAGFLGSSLGDGSGVLGSGLNLGQVGGLLGAAAGAIGSGSGLNSATQKTQNQIDPNLKPYVYGANGLVPQTNALLQSQMATGGLNANQTAGLNSQLAVLNDPNYSAGFNQARTLGQSLMGNGVAGNPFTSGQASLTPNPSQLMGYGAALLPGQDPMNQRRTIQPVRGGLLGA